MYKEKVLITSVDVDSNLELRLSNLFKFLQVIGSNHVATLKAGHADLMKHNLLWVVIRFDVQIYRTPKLDEEILITTHPGEQKSFIFPRYYEIYDKHKNLIISASSMWALIDKDTRRVSVKPPHFPAIKAESIKEDIPLPLKVSSNASTLVEKRKVNYTDIDLNGHLNNTSYIEYILNLHDNDFLKDKRIKRITINYDKEIKPTDIVELYKDGDNPECIKGIVDGSLHFIAELEFEKR